MGRSQTQRFFRRTSRRIRFYLPLVLLLLTVMVLYLPLSAPWMARWAGERLSGVLGAEVRFERLEFTLASATLEAYGVTIGEGAEPFRVGRVSLTGSFTALVAGGGRWPAEVLLEGVSPLEARRGADGNWVAMGPAETLRVALTHGGHSTNADDTVTTGTAAHSPAGGIERTPRLTVRNAEVRLLDLESGAPPFSVMLVEAVAPARNHRDAPLNITGRGLVIAETIEDFSVKLVALPDAQSVTAQVNLSGLAWKFPIPALEELDLAARGLVVDGRISALSGGAYSAGLSARAASFEMAVSGATRESWREEDFEIRANGTFSLTDPRLDVTSLRLMGRQVDIAASGAVELTGDYLGDMRVSITRLPGAALSIGRRELRELTGIDVLTAGTSPTLTLAARARGPFARPFELEEELSVRLAGWIAEAEDIPGRVDIHHLDVDIRPGSVNLGRLDIGLADFNFRASGRVPVYTQETGNSIDKGVLRIQANGNAREAVSWLAARGILPREIRRMDLPVEVEGAIPMALSRSFDNGRPEFEFIPAEPTFSLRIGNGEVLLRDFSDPIRLRPAVLNYTPGRVDLRRFAILKDGVSLIADATMTGAGILEPWDVEDLWASGDFVVEGEINEIIALCRRFGLIDRIDLPRNLGGMIRADVTLDGDVAHPLRMNYTGRLDLEGVTAIIPTPYHPVNISRLDATVALDPSLVELRRLAISIQDDEMGDSTANLRARATNDRIEGEGSFSTWFQFLTAVAARDLADVYMEGPLPGDMTFSLTPREGLPEAGDTLQRWIALFSRKDLDVSIRRNADLIVDYRVDYNQPYPDPENPVSIFPREFPVPISDIRGNGFITPDGITLENMRANFGSSRDVRANARIDIRPPVKVEFEAWIDHIDINEWTDGWGERPWAAPPVTGSARWRSFAESTLMVQIDGTMHARSADFLRFTGRNLQTGFHMKISSRRPPRLLLSDLSAEIYGGTAEGQLRFLFPSGQRPWFRADADIQNADLHRFIHDLHELPEEQYDRNKGLDGALSGSLVFSGQLLNYPTYTGEAQFLVKRSAFVGQVILPYARNIIRLGTTGDPRSGTIRGSVTMRDQRINFPDLEIIDPAMLLAANGHIDFRARLFFEVTASVISQRLRNIPIIQYVGDIIDIIGKEAVYYYNLRGTLGEPVYYPVPRIIDHADRLGRLLREGLWLFTSGDSTPPESSNRR